MIAQLTAKRVFKNAYDVLKTTKEFHANAYDVLLEVNPTSELLEKKCTKYKSIFNKIQRFWNDSETTLQSGCQNASNILYEMMAKPNMSNIVSISEKHKVISFHKLTSLSTYIYTNLDLEITYFNEDEIQIQNNCGYLMVCGKFSYLWFTGTVNKLEYDFNTIKFHGKLSLPVFSLCLNPPFPWNHRFYVLFSSLRLVFNFRVHIFLLFFTPPFPCLFFPWSCFGVFTEDWWKNVAP